MSTKGVPRQHVAKRHRPRKGALMIYCKCGQYQPPRDATPKAQEEAFIQHRIAMGEDVAPTYEWIRMSCDVPIETKQAFAQQATALGMTERQFMRHVLHKAAEGAFSDGGTDSGSTGAGDAGSGGGVVPA